MRAELGAAVVSLFAHQDTAPEPVERDAERLVSLAALVVRCRSAVERDGYTREVELIPESEAPTRLVVVLDRLLAGLRSLGVDAETAWRVIRDCCVLRLLCQPSLGLCLPRLRPAFTRSAAVRRRRRLGVGSFCLPRRSFTARRTRAGFGQDRLLAWTVSS